MSEPQQAASHRRRGQERLLTLSCALCLAPALFWGAAQGSSHVPGIVPVCIMLAVFAVGLISCARGSAVKHSHPVKTLVPAVSASACLGMAVIVVLTALPGMLATGPLRTCLLGLSACAIGAGLTVLCIRMVCTFADMEPVGLIRMLAHVTGMAGALYAGLRLVPVFTLAGSLSVLLLVAGASVCMVCTATGKNGAGQTGSNVAGAKAAKSQGDRLAEAGSAHSSGHASRRVLIAISDGAFGRVEQLLSARASLAAFARFLWIPLASLALVAYITGLTWDPVISVEGAWRTAANQLLGSLLGSLLCMGALLALARSGEAARSLGLLSRAGLPLALILVLMVPVLVQMRSIPALDALCSVAPVSGFSYVCVACTILAVTSARVCGISAGRTAGLICCIAGICTVAGLLTIRVLGPHGRVLCFVVETLFLGAILIHYALRPLGLAGAMDAVPAVAHSDARTYASAGHTGTPGRDSRADGVAGGEERSAHSTGAGQPEAGVASGTHNDEERFRARCQAIADAHGLSPREADVLVYLARGYGSPYIAQVLAISENTVRTHVRHIYEKMGVTSRPMLISLVDSWQQA